MMAATKDVLVFGPRRRPVSFLGSEDIKEDQLVFKDILEQDTSSSPDSE